MQQQDPFHTIRICAIIEPLPGFKTISFEEGHGIPFKAGQYLTLLHPKDESIRRSYSITTAPVLQEPLTIGVKRIANGLFSRWLADEAVPGDVLQTIGSGGLFVLPDNI